MRATLNGVEALTLRDGISVCVAEVHPGISSRGADVVLAASREAEEIWRTVLPQFEPDPTSMATDLNNLDYRAVYWSPADLLVVVGESVACLLDCNSGALRNKLELGTTGVASLDFLDVRRLEKSDVLLIASPRVLWLIDRQGHPHGAYRYPGPIESVAERIRGELSVAVYDVENANLPVIEHTISIGDLSDL